MSSVPRSKMLPLGERGNSHQIPEKLRREVLARDGERCQICGATDRPKVAHRVPLCRGGKTVVWNLVILCESCWRAKGGQLAEEFIRTPYVQFKLLGLGNPLEGGLIRVKIVYLDGETIEGEMTEHPKRVRGDFFSLVPDSDGAEEVLIRNRQVRSIHIYPTLSDKVPERRI